ncbi:MAG TPA: 1,4-beta-xylanase, partial [Granulicella sp.]
MMRLAKTALFVSLLSTVTLAQQPARWSAAKANAWYEQQPWLVGANYVPSDAINQLEMFQAATWNPQLNDKELGMAQSIGM